MHRYFIIYNICTLHWYNHYYILTELTSKLEKLEILKVSFWMQEYMMAFRARNYLLFVLFLEAVKILKFYNIEGSTTTIVSKIAEHLISEFSIFCAIMLKTTVHWSFIDPHINLNTFHHSFHVYFFGWANFIFVYHYREYMSLNELMSVKKYIRSLNRRHIIHD